MSVLLMLFSITTAFGANRAIPVQEGKWQLIGINGYHQNRNENTTGGSGGGGAAGSCSGTACMDIASEDIALVSIKGAVNFTYDANTTGDHKDPNGVFTATPPAGYVPIFTLNGEAGGSPAMLIENDGSILGSEAHSILGIQALDHDDTRLKMVAIAIAYDKDDAVYRKHYTSSLKRMYIKSDQTTSSSKPDVAILYQSTLEGKEFKIMFSAGTSFIHTATNQRDNIYVGKFSQKATFSNPLTIEKGLEKVAEPSGSSGSGPQTTYDYADYRSIANVFDMNLTNNPTGFFNPLSIGVEPLEGNLTVYEYTRLTEVPRWRAATLYGKRGAGVANPQASDGTSIPDVWNDETGKEGQDGYSDFTKGMGYWVRFDANGDASVKPNYGASASATVPGFLAGDSMKPSEYSTDFIKSGWNLLALNDGTIRYTTTGIALKMDGGMPTSINIASGDEVHYVKTTIAAGADVAAASTACGVINTAISKANDKNTSMLYGVNKFNLRCYPVVKDADSFILLVGDDRFGVDYPADAYGADDSVTGNIFRLSGQDHTAFDQYLTVGATAKSTPVIVPKGTPNARGRIWSRFGDYVMGVKLNEEILSIAAGAHTNFKQMHKFTVTIPALDSSSGKEPESINFADAWATDQAGAAASSAAISAKVAAVAGRAGGHGTAWLKAEDNATALIAMDKRFYVSDDVFVRTYDLTDTVRYQSEDLNGTSWQVLIRGNGKEGLLIPTTNAYNNGLFTANFQTPAAGDFQDKVFMQILNTDKNASVAFMSSEFSNYDILEANASKIDGTICANIPGADCYSNMDILIDKQVGQTADKNASVYGAITGVHLGTQLTTAAIVSGKAVPGVSTENLTHVPVYVESFPNDGPLYYLSALGLRPEVLMTSTTSVRASKEANASAVISWKAVDTTRDPAQWFDDATGYDLFKTQAGSGYWIYLTEGYNVKDAVKVEDVKFKLTGYHHFDNKRPSSSNPYSVTFNHADGIAEATIDGLYRTDSEGKNYTSGESFNVQAIIGGRGMAMNTENKIGKGAKAKFEVKLNDYEMPGFQESEAPTDLDVLAADGLGARATKDGEKIPFIKPSAPVVKAEGSKLTIESRNAKYLFVFENNISDVSYPAQIKFNDKMKVAEGNSTEPASIELDMADGTFASTFKFPKGKRDLAPVDLKGVAGVAGVVSPVKDLRFVTSTGAKENIGKEVPVFMSNQYHYKFAPLYSGAHILQAVPLAVADTFGDEKPYDTVAKKQLEANKGVAVFAGKGKEGLAVAYPGSVSKESNIHNAHFANTLYVGYGTDNIATIQYTNEYKGQYFFLYDPQNKQLYYSVFPDLSNVQSAAGRPYQLTLIEGSLQKIEKPAGSTGGSGAGNPPVNPPAPNNP